MPYVYAICFPDFWLSLKMQLKLFLSTSLLLIYSGLAMKHSQFRRRLCPQKQWDVVSIKCKFSNVALKQDKKIISFSSRKFFNHQHFRQVSFMQIIFHMSSAIFFLDSRSRFASVLYWFCAINIIKIFYLSHFTCIAFFHIIVYCKYKQQYYSYIQAS